MSTTSKQDTFAEYRKEPGLNKSWLDRMGTSPLHFKVNPQREDTPALDIGRLIHLCTLEHELFLDSVVVWGGGRTKPTKALPEGRPTWNKNSSDYKDFHETQTAAGKTVVEASDIVLCERIRTSVLKHPVASKLFDVGQSETSIYWTHPLGVDCKSRIDFMGATTVDLKSARDLTPDAFNRAILNYGYHIQAAFYADAVEALTGEKRPYSIVAVEKCEPFDVVVYELDDMILDLGRQTYTRWIERYVECLETDSWPGIGPEAIKAELPPYAYHDFDDVNIFVDGKEVK